MIPSKEIREKARVCCVPETTVERDYAQNWLLKYIPTKNMILKDGTGIRKLYIANYRFSDDLDFTLLEDLEENDLEDEISNSVKGAKEESGMKFDDRTQKNADNPDFKYTELTEEFIRIFYRVYNKWGYGVLEKVYEIAMVL